jgi:hypothetical protein
MPLAALPIAATGTAIGMIGLLGLVVLLVLVIRVL